MGKYEAILKIAEQGNITKAAMELGYTQANLSHIVHRMEEEFQCILFHRERRGVYPTAVGNQMIEIMRQIEELENELYITAMSNRDRILRVSSIYSVSGTILPDILNQFYNQFPDAVVTVLEYGTWAEIENAVKTGDVDLAFYGGTYYVGHEFIPMYQEPYYCVVSEDHPLAEQEMVSVKEMSQYDIILPSEGTSNAVIRDLVKELHMAPNLIPKLEGDRGTVALVEGDLGISLLPGLALRHTRRRVKAIPVKEDPVRTVGILCRSYYELPDIAKTFIQLAKDAFDGLSPAF